MNTLSRIAEFEANKSGTVSVTTMASMKSDIIS